MSKQIEGSLDMSTKEEYRRQLGILAGEAMKLSTDIADAMKEFTRRAEYISQQARQIWHEIDDSLNGDPIKYNIYK